MMTKSNLLVLIVATSALVAADADAHELRGYVSASGVEFIEAQIPDYVPKTLAAPPLSRDFACVTATQKNTTVDLEVLNLDLAMPGQNKLRVDVTIAANAQGRLDIENPYVCLGSAGCSDEINIDAARAVIEFDMRIENGQPTISLSTFDLVLDEDDIDVTLSDCAIDGVLNTVIGFAKGWILGFLEEKVEEMAITTVGPLLQDMIGGFLSYNLALGGADIAVAVNDVLIEPGAIQVGVDIDAQSQQAAAECVGADPGEPVSIDGTANFATGMNAHLGLAVNFGLVNDALYHVWRRGLTCLSGDHLEALGLHLDFEHISALLPGFPSGTELSLNIKLDQPPSIRGVTSAAAATVSVDIEGINVEIVASLPDGTERILGISMDANATGAVAIDPTTNSLVARLGDAEMTRMDLDELAAAQLGWDSAQVITMMNTQVVPSMLKKIGDLPVTGSMFNFADYAIILRGLDTSSEAFLQAEVDLFRAPANDGNAPDTTIVGSPSGTTSPLEAKIRVSGTDGEIPSELLRYQVTVDDVIRPLSPMTQFSVGEIGVTKTYLVRVAAVDLNNNTDNSPAAMELLVDGISPTVLVAGPRSKLLDSGGPVELEWTSSDDLTSADRLLTAVKIYRLADPKNPVTAELIEEQMLSSGQTKVTVDVGSGSVYRVEINVTDEAGNTSTSAMLLDVSGGCGCQATPTAGGIAPIIFAFFFASLVMRRRRRREDG